MADPKPKNPIYKKNKSIEDLKHFIVITADGCHIWNLHKSKNGFGEVTWSGKTTMVHRIMWANKNGPIPQDATIHHKCKHSDCCNPDHLLMKLPGGAKKKRTTKTDTNVIEQPNINVESAELPIHQAKTININVGDAQISLTF